MRTNNKFYYFTFIAFVLAICICNAQESTKPLVLKNGIFHIGTGEVLKYGTMIVEKGIIKNIGIGISTPKNAVVVDLKGAHVAPGVVALFNIGRVGVGLGRGSVKDFLDPFDVKIKQGLAAGITSYAGGSPGRGLTGSNYVLKLTYGDIDSMFLCENKVIGLSTSELLGRGKNKINKAVSAFLKWRRDYDNFISKKTKKEPKPPKEAIGLIKAYKREVMLWINSVRSLREIKTALSFINKINIPAVLNGVVEGWIIADEIGKTGSMAVVWPRMIIDKNKNLIRESGATIEVPAVLAKAGIRIACLPAPRGYGAGGLGLGGILGRDMNTPFIPPAFAVRGGLQEKEAVSTVTLYPAQMLGLGYRLGSLEKGKDADFIVLTGHPLHYQTLVQKTYINGKCYYDRTKEPFLRDVPR